MLAANKILKAFPIALTGSSCIIQFNPTDEARPPWQLARRISRRNDLHSTQNLLLREEARKYRENHRFKMLYVCNSSALKEVKMVTSSPHGRITHIWFCGRQIALAGFSVVCNCISMSQRPLLLWSSFSWSCMVYLSSWLFWCLSHSYKGITTASNFPYINEC